MPADHDGELPGLALSLVVLAAAAFMARRQWAERGRRSTTLGEDDARHFARQDIRRFLGTALMAILAAGIAFGSRLGPIRDRAEARFFARTWVAIAVLCAALLGLALADWLATHAYARRHRRALADERRALMEEEVRRRAVPRDGRPGSNGSLGH